MVRKRILPVLQTIAVLLLVAGETLPMNDAVQRLKLRASDAKNYENFAHAVALFGGTAVVGKYRDSDGGTHSGTAYVYDLTTGQELFKLTAADIAQSHNLGYAVAVSGNTILAGAPGDDSIQVNAGSAYLYDRTTGQELLKLTASDATQYDSFGEKVAIDGNIALVGADSNDDKGAAYVFDVTTGLELFKLRAADTGPLDKFGGAVALSGDTALIGAWWDDDGGLSSGSAYLFDVTTGQELFKLTASDALPGAEFGRSVSVSGNRALVAAAQHDGRGAAYVYDVTTGQQLFKLTSEDIAASDLFGFSVALSGDLALIGARGDSDAGIGSGSAYVFDVRTGQQLLKITAEDAEALDLFGHSVDLKGNMALVGAIRDDDQGTDAGAAYVFDLNITLVPIITEITPHRGPLAGGNTITLSGSAFTPDATVTFGGMPGGVTYVSASELQVVVPAGAVAPPGPGNPRRMTADVDVVVTTPHGQDTMAKGYSYNLKK